jgi:hypothetical protein
MNSPIVSSCEKGASEKGASLLNQATSNSNESSSTFYSKISMSSLRWAATHFKALQPREKADDIEQQGVPLYSKSVVLTVPKSEHVSVIVRNGLEGSTLIHVHCSGKMPDWLPTISSLQCKRTKLHALPRLQLHSCTITSKSTDKHTDARN